MLTSFPSGTACQSRESKTFFAYYSLPATGSIAKTQNLFQLGRELTVAGVIVDWKGSGEHPGLVIEVAHVSAATTLGERSGSTWATALMLPEVACQQVRGGRPLIPMKHIANPLMITSSTSYNGLPIDQEGRLTEVESSGVEHATARADDETINAEQGDLSPHSDGHLDDDSGSTSARKRLKN